MKKSGIFFLCSLFTSVYAQTPAYDIIVGLYVKAYSRVAVKEMKLYHIPASITLAQGIIESGAGQSSLAKEANNHFGIKCHKDWTGKTYFQDDEKKQECFRKYDHADESFRDHSYFLTQRDRYKGLFSLSPTDYRGWAEGLESAGYATNRQYAEILIRTIEQYRLDQYDLKEYPAISAESGMDQDYARYPWVFNFAPAGYAADKRKIYENNGIKCVVAKATDRISSLAVLLNVTEKKLLKFNDLESPASLEPGQVIYLEPKKRRSAVEFHIVQQGESLYEISQHYGIKMKFLLKHSGMSVGMDPYQGQVMPLR